jgi:hypothetical protein
MGVLKNSTRLRITNQTLAVKMKRLKKWRKVKSCPETVATNISCTATLLTSHKNESKGKNPSLSFD